MITLSLLVCLIGLIVWGIARLMMSPSPRVDWIGRVGELSFFAGLLAYLLNIGMKTL